MWCGWGPETTGLRPAGASSGKAQRVPGLRESTRRPCTLCFSLASSPRPHGSVQCGGLRNAAEGWGFPPDCCCPFSWVPSSCLPLACKHRCHLHLRHGKIWMPPVLRVRLISTELLLLPSALFCRESHQPAAQEGSALQPGMLGRPQALLSLSPIDPLIDPGQRSTLVLSAASFFLHCGRRASYNEPFCI